MKHNNNLLPHSYKKIGWILFVPSAILAIVALFNALPDNLLTTKMPTFLGGAIIESGDYHNDWLNEIYIVGLALSLLFIGFSKEKDEDELIAMIRLSSIAFAAKASTIVLIIGTLIIYGLHYLTYVFIYLFVMMLIFIGKYQYELYKFRKGNKEVQS